MLRKRPERGTATATASYPGPSGHPFLKEGERRTAAAPTATAGRLIAGPSNGYGYGSNGDGYGGPADSRPLQTATATAYGYFGRFNSTGTGDFTW